MPWRKTTLIVAVLALAVALPDPAAARRLRCPAPFATSCLERLYRRFDAAGPCTRDLSRYFSEGRVTDCWANGAFATLTGFGGAPGTSRLVDSRGRTVLEGTTADGSVAGAIRVTYARRRRTWHVERAATADWTVTCPSGRHETFAAADVAAGTGCGPLAECDVGICPTPE
jgi:hypothetical protein